MPEKKDLILYCQDHGDPSVGIGPTEVELNLHDLEIDESNRTQMKKDFETFCSGWLDMTGPVDSWFSDECPDCHQQYENESSQCTNQNCINCPPEND